MVVENVLRPKVYDALAREYPPMPVVMRDRPLENNLLYEHPSSLALKDPKISELWKTFIRYHVSRDFYLEVLRVFQHGIAQEYPDLIQRSGKPLEDWKTGIRFQDKEVDIGMDCQFSINSPVTKVSSVRGHHLDRTLKLFAGLFYMRHPDDDTEGSDLQFFGWKKPSYANNRKAKINPDHVELIKTVPYRANTLVFYLNTPRSIHAVTPRQKTNHVRRYVNFFGDVPFHLYPRVLFKKRKKRKNMWERIASFGEIAHKT